MAYNYWENATIFEYGPEGLLIDYYYHTAGTRWQIKNPTCQLVEAVSGQGGETFGDVYGLGIVPLGKGFNFRVYVTKVWAGVPTNEWIDITDLPNRADWGFLDDTTEDQRWIWTVDSKAYTGMIRQDRNFLINKLNFTKSDGMIRFTLGSMETYDSQYRYKILEIPPGQLDIFLNKRSLVYGLDYTIIDKQVVISCLQHLNPDPGAIQEIIYRGAGFPTPDMKMYPPGEIGWLEYGVVSNNGVYNLHRHKMQRITIAGSYMDPEKVVFEEDRTDVKMPYLDATPYQIQTPQSRFRDVYSTDQAARIKDDAIDQEVSDYMSLYFPNRVRPFPDTFRNHYHVFSVFANKVLQDIVTGRLNPGDSIKGRYSDMQIRTWCKAYEWLVPFDIVNSDYNKNHVQVYPHWHTNPVGLNQYQYAFFKRILGLYLRDPMDLAQFIIQTG